jgi:hypothetical protein
MNGDPFPVEAFVYIYLLHPKCFDSYSLAWYPGANTAEAWSWPLTSTVWKGDSALSLSVHGMTLVRRELQYHADIRYVTK